MLSVILACAVLSQAPSKVADKPPVSQTQLTPDRTWTPEPGDEGVVWLDDPQKVRLAAADFFSCNAMVKAFEANDDDGLKQLRESKRVAGIPHLTPVRIIKVHDNPYSFEGYRVLEIRILGGENSGKSAWMVRSAIQKLISPRFLVGNTVVVSRPGGKADILFGYDADSIRVGLQAFANGDAMTLKSLSKNKKIRAIKSGVKATVLNCEQDVCQIKINEGALKGLEGWLDVRVLKASK